MNWTCEQTELRLSDYLEGLLHAEERHTFDAHVNSCPRCTPLVAGVSHLLANLHSMEEVEPPPRLVRSILDQTLGPRQSAKGWAGALLWIRGVASLRFAYGALSVAATLVILLTASGFSWRKPKLADLAPANIYRNADRQAHLVFARGTKFVSDLRVVYEIQSRLRENEELPPRQENTVPQSSPQKEPGRSDGSQPASPKQQNRANDVGSDLRIFTASALSPSFWKIAAPGAPLGFCESGRRTR